MTFLRTVLPVAGLLVATATAQAQTGATTTDPRWTAFLGCWGTWSPGYKGPTVCLLPTDSSNSVEVVAVSNDTILSRSLVTANGKRVRMTREGCTGWESANWSQDDRRLFTRAEFSCGTGAPQVSTGIYAMSQNDEGFVRVEGVRTKGSSRARVVNFTWVDTVRVPRDIAARLPRAAQMRVNGARIESAAEVTTADVVEATEQVDADVVAAWIGSRGQSFRVAARDLRALRDRKVPTDVIDMMVAVSYPKVFAVQPGLPPDVRASQQNRPMGGAVDQLALANVLRMRDAMAFGWGDMLYGYSPFLARDPFFSPFYGSFFNRWNAGFNPYFNNVGFYNGFYNGLYGGGFGNGFWAGGGGTFIGNGPYVITPAQPTRVDPPGRVINGLGYSASGGGGGSAQPSGSISNSGGSSGGGSSGVNVQSGYSGSGSGSSASGGGGERTAKPRP